MEGPRRLRQQLLPMLPRLSQAAQHLLKLLRRKM
jgi:hypothetical protein